MPFAGLLSPLTGDARAEVLRLWDRLEGDYGTVAGQFILPAPYGRCADLSYLGGRCDDVPALIGALTALVATLPPFEVTLSGLGKFEESRVLYVRVLPDSSLRATHQALHAVMSRHYHSLIYTPAEWVPHVTLAMSDWTEETFHTAWEALTRCGLRPEYRQTVSSIWMLQLDEASDRWDVLREWTLSAPQPKDYP